MAEGYYLQESNVLLIMFLLSFHYELYQKLLFSIPRGFLNGRRLFIDKELRGVAQKYKLSSKSNQNDAFRAPITPQKLSSILHSIMPHTLILKVTFKIVRPCHEYVIMVENSQEPRNFECPFRKEPL